MNWLDTIERKVDPWVGKSPMGYKVLSGNSLPAADAVKLIAAVRVAEEALGRINDITQGKIWNINHHARILHITETTDQALAKLQSGEFTEESDK